MSVPGESITTVSPDGERIPKNKLSEISITGNKITQDPDDHKMVILGIDLC